MGYNIKFGDITKFKSDAIVNSLGVNGSVYGRLCESILEAADSTELTNYINSLVNNKIGEIFVTNAGKLNCKNILHIVTPFRHKDDFDCSLLKKAYTDLLDKAISLGFKEIVLPFIGSGANGYSEQEVSEVVTSVCGDLALKEYDEHRDILDITIVSYVKPRQGRRIRENEVYFREKLANEILMSREYENVYSHCEIISLCDILTPKLSREQIKLRQNTMLILQSYEHIKEDELLFVKGTKTTPYKYVLEHMIDTGFDDREIIKQGVPKDVKHTWTKRKTLEKQNIYRLAFITKMSFTRLVQFMMINEKSFNPYDELDMFVLKYFLGGYYYKCYKLVEFSVLCYKECKVKLEFKRNNKGQYEQ